jgi:hypothetical protein
MLARDCALLADGIASLFDLTGKYLSRTEDRTEK